MVARDKVYDVPHPIVLGHEGAGIVEKVGADVQKVAPGDPVVLSYPSCGRCRPCYLGKPYHCVNAYPLCFGGSRLDGSTETVDGDGNAVHDHFFGQSSFGTYSIAYENNVVKIPKEAPLELLGPLGCGIQTGAGAVINGLKVGPGASFVAFGAGAVGLSGVMAARIAGATKIIAADIVPERLETAGIQLGKETSGEFFVILGGILSIVLGAYLFANPGAGLLAFIWLIGVYAILFGILMVIIAFRLCAFRKVVTESK